MPLSFLFIAVTISFSTAEIWDGATFYTKYTGNISYPNNDIEFPQYLPDGIDSGSISPVVGYYDDNIILIDGTDNNTYEMATTDNNPIWIDKNKQIPSTARCITSACYTQIDTYLYILYDNTNKILKYNMGANAFVGSFSFAHPGYYCLVNDEQYIYAIGNQPNIIIIDSETGYNSTSTPYLPNDISTEDAFACSIDAHNNIYIFIASGAFVYSISDDTLSTLYYNKHELPYSDNGNISAITSNNLTWIQNTQYMYPFSTVTHKFLKCRAELYGIESRASLLSIDAYILRFGGLDIVDGVTQYITELSAVDATFYEDRFVLDDWYYPGNHIGFNYSTSFAAAVAVTKVQITFYSDDFNLTDDNISFQKDDNDDVTILCAGSPCEKGRLKIDLSSMNSDDIDIKDISYSIEATTLSLDDSSLDTFVCNSFQIYPIYLSVNVRLKSAEYFYLQFDYEYVCTQCDITAAMDAITFESSISINAGALGINDAIMMQISSSANRTGCCIDTECDAELSSSCAYILSDLTEIFFDGEYALQLSSTDTFLESSVIEVALSNTTGCRSGTGYDEDTNSCQLCPDGTFSFKSDSSECVSCSGLEGVECDGTEVMVQYRYWVSGYRESTPEYIDLTNITDGDVLLSHICGFGQCCADVDGCNYSDALSKGTLCSYYRDITSAMCTSCEDGYYEKLSTTDCGECEYNRNLWHLIWIFTLAFLLVLYFAFVDAQPLMDMVHNWRHRNDEVDEDEVRYSDLKTKAYTRDQSGKEEEEDDDDSDYEEESDFKSDSEAERYQERKRRRKRVPKKKDYKMERELEMSEAEQNFKFFIADSYIAYSVLLLQILAYYFQGFAEILQSEQSRAFLAPIINLFNFNFMNNLFGNNNGLCFIPKQTSLNELAVTLIFPSLMVLSLLFLSMFCSKGSACIGIQVYWCKLQSPICTTPHIAIAFCRIAMISIGLLFRVLMQLITCTRLENVAIQVQFYHDADCHEAAWWLSMVAMTVFLLYIISVYKKLYSQSDEKRFDYLNKYTKLVQAYKHEYWYWELVITLRRFLLTMFVTLSFIGRGYSNLILCVLLIFFLLIQVYVNPFIHKRNNRVETFCIVSLLIGFIGMNFEDIADSIFLTIFLTAVICIPVVIALISLGGLCQRCIKYFHGDEQYYIDHFAKNDRRNNTDDNEHGNASDKMDTMMVRVLGRQSTQFLNRKKRKNSNDYASKGRTQDAPHTVKEIGMQITRNTTKGKDDDDSESSTGLK